MAPKVAKKTKKVGGKKKTTTKAVKADTKTSKTSTANIDLMLETIVGEFNIKESDLKTLLRENNLLPRTSKFAHAKKRKDPDAPKRARSAYIFFTMDQRKKGEHADEEVKDQTKAFGKAWKKLSKKGRAKFDKLAEEDKKRYEKEMKKWRKTHPEESKKRAHEDDPDYIENPETGKYVRRDGAIGKKLVAENDDAEVENSDEEEVENSDVEENEVSDVEENEVSDGSDSESSDSDSSDSEDE